MVQQTKHQLSHHTVFFFNRVGVVLYMVQNGFRQWNISQRQWTFVLLWFRGSCNNDLDIACYFVRCSDGHIHIICRNILFRNNRFRMAVATEHLGGLRNDWYTSEEIIVVSPSPRKPTTARLWSKHRKRLL